MGSTSALTKETHDNINFDSSFNSAKVEATTKDPITAAAIGKLILDKAKSKFASKVSSLLMDAIFGSSGPQIVDLSEQSLQEIQNRVRQELIRTAEYEFLADFNSMEGTLEHYSDTVSNNYNDEVLLTNLVVKANDVMNHHALNANFNSDYFYMADSYALAATVAMSINTERNIIGAISDAFVSSRGDQYGNTLQTMVNGKKSTMLPLRERCEMKTTPYDLYDEEECVLRDPFGNHIASATIYDGDWDQYDRWEQKMDSAEAAYYEKHFGQLEEIVTDLRNF